MDPKLDDALWIARVRGGSARQPSRPGRQPHRRRRLGLRGAARTGAEPCAPAGRCGPGGSPPRQGRHPVARRARHACLPSSATLLEASRSRVVAAGPEVATTGLVLGTSGGRPVAIKLPDILYHAHLLGPDRCRQVDPPHAHGAGAPRGRMVAGGRRHRQGGHPRLDPRPPAGGPGGQGLRDRPHGGLRPRAQRPRRRRSRPHRRSTRRGLLPPVQRCLGPARRAGAAAVLPHAGHGRGDPGRAVAAADRRGVPPAAAGRGFSATRAAPHLVRRRQT